MSINIQSCLNDYNNKLLNKFSQKAISDIQHVYYFKTNPSGTGTHTATAATSGIGIATCPFSSSTITTAGRYNNSTENIYGAFFTSEDYDITHSYIFDGTDVFHVVKKTKSCFPFDAIATTPTGKKRCEDLVIGEQVLVDHKGNFEPILFFGHRENYETQFVELTLANGKKMSATPQHYIFSYNNKKKTLIPIQDVRTGDFVKYNGKRIKVSEIAIVRKKGFVSPMTKSCEIVIDGVQASCCTDKYTLAVLKPLVDAVDALGITVPLQVVDPIRDLGNAVINKFHL